MNQEERNVHLRERVNVAGQFAYENGVEITYVDSCVAHGTLTVGETSYNPYRIVHGGALMTLADTVAGVCAASCGGRFVTAASSFEFLRPATGATIRCIAIPKKMGKALPIIAVELLDDNDKAVATGTVTFFRIGEG